MLINGIVCEGPKCEKGANGQRFILQWDSEAVKQDGTKMPDAFFKFSNWQPMYEEPAPDRQEQPRVRQFCSTQCVIDYLRHVDAPRSPREQAAIAENNKQVELKKAEKEKQPELPFDSKELN